MKVSSFARPSRLLQGATLLLLAVLASLRGQGPARTSFKELPQNDPKQEIVRTVLGSRVYSMRALFPDKEWTEGGYGAAWERARRYFPRQVYFIRPGTYFMTHGFGPDGKLYMEIHESAYLDLSVENLATFTGRSVLAAYGRMRSEAEAREAASFREKLGRLEPYFREEAANKRLRTMLGAGDYGHLLQALREENYHMFAGGLMHEGMHAMMDDDVLVARIQADFAGGRLPVQWDELRAYAAEIIYHKMFSGWAAGEIGKSWGRIEGLLRELEPLRRKAAPLAGTARAGLEAVEARVGASILLVRLRMREAWQSARRVQGLATRFAQDYAKPGPPPGVEALLEDLQRDVDAFADDVSGAIGRTELSLQALEDVLELWDQWARGGRPFPPTKPDSDAIAAAARGTAWPVLPGTAMEGLKSLAEREIARLGTGLHF